MQAIINKIKYIKPVEIKGQTKYQFSCQYEDAQGEVRTGTFLADSEEQDVFKEGTINEFNEYKKEWKDKIYYNLYPKKKKGSGGGSNFARKMQTEQARYSGFSMSYAKDLRVAGKIETKEEMFEEADDMFEWMVRKDKELKDGK